MCFYLISTLPKGLVCAVGVYFSLFENIHIGDPNQGQGRLVHSCDLHLVLDRSDSLTLYDRPLATPRVSADLLDFASVQQ